MKRIPLNLLVIDVEKIKERAKSNLKQPNGDLKASIRKARYILKLLEKYNFKCFHCPTKENLTIHHLISPERTKIGNWRKSTAKNFKTAIILCVDCHNKEEEKYFKYKNDLSSTNHSGN